MSNTVITNYTDLNGPTTKADSCVVVVVNKDGSLSVDKSALGTLMSNDRSQGAGISVVRIGHDGPPDDATDSENDDDIPHITLSVDSYCDDPNTVIKYDSGADMFHSLRIETREISLVGFQNDHCYTALASPGLTAIRSDAYSGLDEPILEIKAPQPSQDVPSSKKITILEQKILPQGRKISINPNEAVILKGNDIINKPLVGLKAKAKPQIKDEGSDENVETSSSVSSSGDSVVDRDSDSDYKGRNKLNQMKLKKSKVKPRILKNVLSKAAGRPKLDSRAKILKPNKNVVRKEIKEKLLLKGAQDIKKVQKSSISEYSTPITHISSEVKKETPKATTKLIKKEKKTPSHVTALLSDMTTLFSTPDVIRRVSSDAKTPTLIRKSTDGIKGLDQDEKITGSDKSKGAIPKIYSKVLHKDKSDKSMDLMPQIDDVSLAQILQDPPGIMTTSKAQPVTSTALIKDFAPTTTVSSTALAGPLSPTLDLLGGLQPEEEGLTEDLLMHVAQLVESSDNLKEVIDKQVLGKVDAIAPKQSVSVTPGSFVSTPSSSKTVPSKQVAPRKDPIEIVRRDGRVITLPPIEAPATRASKRKSAMFTNPEMSPGPSYQTTSSVTSPSIQDIDSPDPRSLSVPKHYSNKKTSKSQDQMLNPVDLPSHDATDIPLETDSLNSEDDPNRLWCICKQPHNNRFMICCDQCEDWFHGKCVNITKAMGQQMEEQGVEWTCPNCIKKASPTSKSKSKAHLIQKKIVETQSEGSATNQYSVVSKNGSSKLSCIVCKKTARACSIYCSDACIMKHAQDSLGPQSPAKIDSHSGIVSKTKFESRVIVFERKTGRCLAGPNAPTAENLKAWLQKNPTFEVVRPGTLSAIKPSVPSKKPSTPEPRKIQTTLNFEKIPKKSLQSPKMEKDIKTPVKEELKLLQPAKTTTPTTPKHMLDPRPSTSTATPKSELKKYTKPVLNRSRSSTEKAPSSPVTPMKKDSEKRSKTSSVGSIRDNVRKALQEQLTLRLKESSENKLSNQDVKQFAEDTESELHELFNQDVGVKYKAKYRSLMFNIKDRKNLSLWQKICDKSITPKQLVRLSPEELASQELAEWRDNEAKHQLELIKKSELDLLAASKTYVLKTHKGEEVIKPKTAVETELDPNMPVEDVVTALNDPSVMDDAAPAGDDSVVSEQGGDSRKSSGDRSSSSKKKRKDDSKSRRKESRSDTSSRSSRSTRRSSPLKQKEERSTRRSERRMRSTSRDRRRNKNIDSKRKSRDLSRQRSKSRAKSKSKLRSKSRSRSRSRERVSRKRSRSKSKHRSRSRQRRSTRNRPTDTDSRQNQSPKSKLRSKSQDDDKGVIENRDADSRPKSAMTKESHPEYDPHEPMITSAFSDDELRKSREDVYDEACSSGDVGFKGFNEFDPQKVASPKIASELTEVQSTREKLSEGESDQEPSSTVDSSAPTVWTGCINMVDVARFYVAAHEVFGNGSELEEDLSTELDIVGRINPDTVWDYISKMKRTGNKDIVVLRLTAANDEEKMQYIALYSYLSSRNRLGVVKVSNTHTVKDFYILPLPAHETLPSVLALEGASLGEVRSHLLIAIIIRQRRKRSTVSKHPLPAKITRKQELAADTPTIVSTRTSTLPLPFVGPALSDNVRDKIAATLASTDENEPYSPGGSSSSGDTPLLPPKGAPPPTDNLRDKMEELNRQIEEQKQQIMLIAQADSSIAEQNEAYSPSRPMTPPQNPLSAPLADIALPSNLQEILATIKQRESTAPATRRQLRSFTPSQSK